MTLLLIIIGAILAGALVYLATLESTYKVERSLLINAPIDEVYSAVVDFKTWPQWSPWLMHEPETELVYSDDYQQPGGFYSWDGKLVGAGKLTHLTQTENRSIEQRIEFLRPFKSTSAVGWRFKEDGDQTKVTWTMQGRMPFFLRFMTHMMSSMIARDYDLGLHLLNGYLDNDNPHPRIAFAGEHRLDSFTYLYQPFDGHVQDMIEAMQQSFPQLKQQVDELGIAAGKPATIYFRADPQQMYFECEMAIPVAASSDNTALDLHRFSGGRYFKLELIGDYRFLELAWYKAYSHLQMAKLKEDKRRPSLEVYENDPDETENPAELKTSIYLPIK